MVQQFFVFCKTFSVTVWLAILIEHQEFSTIDAEYNVDGERYQYQYVRGKGAELGKNWRERCAIEAHYHAVNSGTVVIAIECPQSLPRRAKTIDAMQKRLPFDETDG